MPKKPRSVADALLDAHVQFIVSGLTGPGLRAGIAAQLDALLADASTLCLEDVTERQTIKDTARTYAAELKPGGGIPELVGHVARALYAHELHDEVRLGDLLSDRRLEEVLDKVLELKSLRKAIVHEAVTSPIYSAFASDLLYHGIQGYLADNPLTRNLPGVGSMMKIGRSVMNKASPKLESAMEESLKKYIGKTVTATASRSAEFVLKHTGDEQLRDMALELWARLKERPVGELRAHVSSLDLEELFVIVYEYWMELRQTDYYREMIDAGIDSFFDRYGATPLPDLLAELGLSRELMVEEAMRHAPRVLKTLKRRKLLEPLVRRNLEPFYRSGEVERVLETRS